MNNIELTIIWHDNEPIAFWFGDKLIWETNDIIAEVDFLETKIALPLVSAVKFSSIFLQGLIANRLLILITTLQIKINELRLLLQTELTSKHTKKKEECFYCDKECNRACDDWNKCHQNKDATIKDNDDDDDEWSNFEENDENN